MPQKPIRVLHVVGSLNRGGTETWLMNVLRRVDRNEYAMDFLVQQESTSGYEHEARELGARVIVCRRDVFWPIRFLRSLHKYGPYDVVHSHRNNFSAMVLVLSRVAGIGGRIAHSHNDFSRSLTSSRLSHWLYSSMTRRILKLIATHRLAVSSAAEKSLFGSPGNYKGAELAKIVFCGIDMEQYQDRSGRSEIRSSLGITDEAVVVGHVGGFRSQKNHRFLLEVFREYVALVPSARLILIGEGSLSLEMMEYAGKLGLESSVSFLGSRGDVPALLSAMDVFLFPSLHEGLPLVLMEAQASNLPSLVSDAVSHESEFVHGLVRWFSLSESAEAWAYSLDEIRTGRYVDSAELKDIMQGSHFNIHTSIATLLSVYREIDSMALKNPHSRTDAQ